MFDRKRRLLLDRLAQQQQREKLNGIGGLLRLHRAELGLFQESDLTALLSKLYGVPSVNLDEVEISPEAIKLLPKEVCETHECIPIGVAGSTLIVAVTDPSNIFNVESIRRLTSRNVDVVVASDDDVSKAIDKHYGGSSSRA